MLAASGFYSEIFRFKFSPYLATFCFFFHEHINATKKMFLKTTQNHSVQYHDLQTNKTQIKLNKPTYALFDYFIVVSVYITLHVFRT